MVEGVLHIVAEDISLGAVEKELVHSSSRRRVTNSSGRHATKSSRKRVIT